MLVKLVAINQEIVNFNSAEGRKNYVVSKIYVNPQHIVALKEDLQYIELHVQNKLPEGFEKNQKFTRILVNRGNMGEEITVVGEIGGIAAKLNEGKNGN